MPTVTVRKHTCYIVEHDGREFEVSHQPVDGTEPTIEELHTPAERKRTHLGYRGLIELVRLAKPKLTLIGEFWAGLEDLRIDLTSGVREMSANANIFPTSIGMTVDLEDNRIVCSTCQRTISAENVRVTAATVLFGPLGYHCPTCTLG